MNEDTKKNVLFLCTGNSARSVLAESVLNRVGAGKFCGYSAGSYPVGAINLFALDLLQRLGYETQALESKSWDVFAQDNAPVMDFVFTVCDNAAGEVCPVWPGQPVSAHWGFRDPAAAEGSDAEKAIVFAEVYKEIESRLSIFVNLPLASLDKLSLQKKLDELGESS